MVEFTRMLSGLLVVKSKSTFILPYTKKKKKIISKPVPVHKESLYYTDELAK